MNTFALCLTLLSICGAISAGSGIDGGKVRITNEKQLKDLTQKVSTYLEKINGQEDGVKLEFIRSRSATVQVVAGFLYEMFAEINENNHPVDCKINLWEKPWMNFVRVDVTCGEEKRKYSYESSSQVDTFGGIVGGYHDMTVKELEELKPKLSAVFDELKVARSDFVYTLKRMVSGKRQVVAGMRYIVKVEATNNAEVVKQCEAVIFQNLKGKFQSVDVKCGGKSFHYPAEVESYGPPGGKTPVTDKKRLETLKKKVVYYLGQIGQSINRPKLEFIRFHSATVQVVSGVLYEILAEINENGHVGDCKLNLWEKSWMNWVRMEVQCADHKYVFEGSSIIEP